LAYSGKSFSLRERLGLQLAERFRRDLADLLTGHVELLADLLQRPGAAVLQPEAELEDPAL
jgi:hypothetical protein